jgi:DNA-binding NarL/FixJ family response regulator
MSPLRVVLADDTHLFRHGLVRLLRAAGVDVVAEVADAATLLEAVAEHRPDAAVVDVRMPPTHSDEGLRAAAAIRTRHPDTAVLVFSAFVETAHLDHLLQAGAGSVGYLLKDRVLHVEEFVAALERVASGGSALDPDVVTELFRRRRSRDVLASLTDREREVLELMAQGMSNAGIAERLFLSPKTVERHIGSVFTKLGLDADEEGHRRVLAVLRHLGAA